MVDNSIKIATLNMNGETYWAINKRPRLPRNIFDIQEVKEKLLKLQMNGLDSLLRESKYDIIAVQELVNIVDYKNQIETVIKNNNYKLIIPKITRTHFICGFIVKNEYCEKNSLISVNLDETLKINTRKVALNISKCDKKYSIVNVHINNHKLEIDNFGDILLGDMNAYSEEQVSNNEEGANVEFLRKIEKNSYKRIGNNTDYTWQSNGIEKCLDHIFVKDSLNASRMDKDDKVNFYYSEQGFTDHSLLAIELII